MLASRKRTFARHWALILSLGGGVACAFDERTLHQALLEGSAGQGGEGADAGVSAGDAGKNSGTSDGAPYPPASLRSNVACPDLDANLVEDCQETLADNAEFETSVEKWQRDSRTELYWRGAKVNGGITASVSVIHSGSEAGDQRTMAGIYQCLEADATHSYKIYAQTLVGKDQASGLAAVSVLFHASDDCSGEHLMAVNSSMLSSMDGWGVLHLWALAPAEAHSMRVRLVAVKELTMSSLEVRFDNVLVRRE